MIDEDVLQLKVGSARQFHHLPRRCALFWSLLARHKSVAPAPQSHLSGAAETGLGIIDSEDCTVDADARAELRPAVQE